MSHEKIEALEIGLYEEYLEELEKKYYGGINKVLGEPWFTKTDAEMEAEAEKSKRIYGSQFINDLARCPVAYGRNLAILENRA